MNAYMLRDDPLEHLAEGELLRRMEGQPVSAIRLVLELARRESRMVLVNIASPADLGRLLFPTAMPVASGVIVVLLTAELRVVAMERLDLHVTPERVLQVALDVDADVIAVARIVDGEELPTADMPWVRTLLAEQRVLDVLLVAGVRWRSMRELMGGV